jgi:hypothetical protein
MSKTTIIKNEYATLEYHSEQKIIHHTFLKPIGNEKFREVLNTGADTMKKYGATKWLSDDRKNMALSPEDTDWSKKNWFPRALESGWKFWALVVPQDILARMNMKEFVDEYYEKGLRIMVFNNPEDALQWLSSIKE